MRKQCQARSTTRTLALLCTRSREVRCILRPQTPLAAPAIDPNYFANEADLDVVVHTIEVVLKLNATSPLSTQVVGIHSPTKEVIAKGKEGLKEYARGELLACLPSGRYSVYVAEGRWRRCRRQLEGLWNKQPSCSEY